MTALVEQLRELVPADSQIAVVTTLPNRYSSYSAEALREESFPGGAIWSQALWGPILSRSGT